MPSLTDSLVAGFDTALRTVAGVHRAARTSPAQQSPEQALDDAQRAHAAALMRVNHAGEICAQALYQGQALTARTPVLRNALQRSAREEEDHLAWCAERIRELGGRTSRLAPVWYVASFALGAAAGAAGDRWSLAFLAETERQVEAHLDGHLAHLAAADTRTRAVVGAMRVDEAKHRETALRLGAAELPPPLRSAMRATARIMTGIAYRL